MEYIFHKFSFQSFDEHYSRQSVLWFEKYGSFVAAVPTKLHNGLSQTT